MVKFSMLLFITFHFSSTRFFGVASIRDDHEIFVASLCSLVGFRIKISIYSLIFGRGHHNVQLKRQPVIIYTRFLSPSSMKSAPSRRTIFFLWNDGVIVRFMFLTFFLFLLCSFDSFCYVRFFVLFIRYEN